MDTVVTMRGVCAHIERIIKLSTDLSLRLSKDRDAVPMSELAGKLGEITGSALLAYDAVSAYVKLLLEGTG